jgi:hypothetical protein
VEIDHVSICVADLNTASHALEAQHELTSVPDGIPDGEPRLESSRWARSISSS